MSILLVALLLINLVSVAPQSPGAAPASESGAPSPAVFSPGISSPPLPSPLSPSSDDTLAPASPAPSPLFSGTLSPAPGPSSDTPASAPSPDTPTAAPSPDTEAPAPSPDTGSDSSTPPAPVPASSTSNADDPVADADGGKAMSGGTKAGIAFGVIFFVFFAVAGGYIWVTRRNNLKRSNRGPAMRF